VSTRAQRREQEESERKRREYLSQHNPITPVHPVLHASGERQLRTIADHLHAVSGLTTNRVHKLNEQLRTGMPVQLDDWLTCVVGFESYDDFALAVSAAFDALGGDVALDSRQTVFRGASADEFDGEMRPGAVVSNAGYSFALQCEEDAKFYMGGEDSDRPPALFKLDVHSALVIPNPEARTHELSGLTFDHLHLRTAVEQLVIPPSLNRWRIAKVRVGPYLYAELEQLPPPRAGRS
jgi:hypothetical protein